MKEESLLEMKKMVRDLPWVLIGNFMLALAVAMFILPYNILSGGVAGIAVALQAWISAVPASSGRGSGTLP